MWSWARERGPYSPRPHLLRSALNSTVRLSRPRQLTSNHLSVLQTCLEGLILAAAHFAVLAPGSWPGYGLLMNDPHVPSPHFMLTVDTPLAVSKNQLACSVSDGGSQCCQAGRKNGDSEDLPQTPRRGSSGPRHPRHWFCSWLCPAILDWPYSSLGLRSLFYKRKGLK